MLSAVLASHKYSINVSKYYGGSYCSSLSQENHQVEKKDNESTCIAENKIMGVELMDMCVFWICHILAV